MDTRFRTSFVPKKALAIKETAPHGGSSVHLFLALGAIIFFLTLAVSTGLYLYKTLLNKAIEEKSVALENAKKAFEMSFIIDAKRLDARIKAARQILATHRRITPVFEALSELTLQTVRYKSLTYSNAPGTQSLLSMEGEAKGYASVALQSDAFAQSGKIENLIFTDVRPGSGPGGGVSFRFSGLVRPDMTLYSNTLPSEAPEEIPGGVVNINSGAININSGNTNVNVNTTGPKIPPPAPPPFSP